MCSGMRSMSEGLTYPRSSQCETRPRISNTPRSGRSGVESTLSMIKRKFGDLVHSVTNVATWNEI